jgi:hypothetical protein
MNRHQSDYIIINFAKVKGTPVCTPLLGHSMQCTKHNKIIYYSFVANTVGFLITRKGKSGF